jgi:hypothetical protein
MPYESWVAVAGCLAEREDPRWHQLSQNILAELSEHGGTPYERLDRSVHAHYDHLGRALVGLKEHVDEHLAAVRDTILKTATVDQLDSFHNAMNKHLAAMGEKIVQHPAFMVQMRRAILEALGFEPGMIEDGAAPFHEHWHQSQTMMETTSRMLAETRELVAQIRTQVVARPAAEPGPSAGAAGPPSSPDYLRANKSFQPAATAHRVRVQEATPRATREGPVMGG